MEDQFEGHLIKNVKEKRENKPEILEEHDINFVIENESPYSVLNLQLEPRKTVLIEASLLCAIDSHVTLLTKLEGGLLQILANRLGKEPLALNQFAVDDLPGKLIISPSLPGDIHHYYLKDKQTILLKASAFLACKPTVQIDTNFSGMKDFYNDDSDFLLRLIGQGDLWFSCYGGLAAIAVTEELWINPDYVTAFEESLSYEVEINEGLSADKLKFDIWGRKGKLCRFQGEGKVWLQSRQENMFLNFILPWLPNLQTLKI
ncbi:MAG: TIGR00266 family protein [Microcystaceae cyanobacterium]